MSCRLRCLQWAIVWKDNRTFSPFKYTLSDINNGVRNWNPPPLSGNPHQSSSADEGWMTSRSPLHNGLCSLQRHLSTAWVLIGLGLALVMQSYKSVDAVHKSNMRLNLGGPNLKAFIVSKFYRAKLHLHHIWVSGCQMARTDECNTKEALFGKNLRKYPKTRTACYSHCYRLCHITKSASWINIILFITRVNLRSSKWLSIQIWQPHYLHSFRFRPISPTYADVSESSSLEMPVSK